MSSPRKITKHGRSARMTGVLRWELRALMYEQIQIKKAQVSASCEAIVSEYKDKLGIALSAEALRRDWSRRQKWESTLIGIQSASNKFEELYAIMDHTKGELYSISSDAKRNKDFSVAVTAIKAVADISSEQCKMLQSTGQLTCKAPEGSAARIMIQGVFWDNPKLQQPNAMPKPAELET
jgi:hypothetical protein